jgi:hypothetical protein
MKASRERNKMATNKYFLIKYFRVCREKIIYISEREEINE